LDSYSPGANPSAAFARGEIILSSSIQQRLRSLSFIILAAFFFLLALYSKRFAYLSFKIGTIPIYISEICLAVVLLLRANSVGALFKLPRVPLVLVFSFLGWGIIRLGYSIYAGEAFQFGLVEGLKQSCVFYLSIWLLVPQLFSVQELKRLFLSAFAGAAAAQVLGWLGFILMGTYGKTFSRLIGFPVGDEVLLPLYPLAYLLLPRPWPELLSLPYGQLWLTQFIIYMKRTWVFSILIFALPLILWRAGKKWKLQLKRLAWPFALSFVMAITTLIYVTHRGEPPLYHRQQSESLKQRAEMPAVARGLLFLLDEVFPYTDPLETQISIQRIVFKGDLLVGDNSTPSFMAFRVHLWKQAWAGFLEKPWFGQGFGNHMLATQLNGLPAMVDGKWISGPHNSFLAVLNRLGILGFVLLTSLIFMLAAAFVRSKKTDFTWLVAASVVNLNFFALFNVCLENPQGGIWYWFFWGMLLKLAYAKEEESR
jgi:hypothetical protein